MDIYVCIGIVVLIAFLFLLSICKVAARADKRMLDIYYDLDPALKDAADHCRNCISKK